MKDDEYPEYLKGKSYGDLLDICSSLKEGGNPTRYTMVLSEIDARKERGDVPTENKFFGPGEASIVLGAILLINFGLDLTKPTSTWILASHSIGGCFSLLYGLWARRKRKERQSKAS